MLFIGLQIFLFLIIIRPQDFVSFMYGAPIVFIVMGVLVTGWIVSSIEKSVIKTAQDKYYALFFTIIVISSLNAGYLSYTKDIAIDTFKIALIYWFCVTIINNEIRLKITLWVAIVLMTVVALMGIMQSYGLDITGGGMYWAPDKEVWQIKGIGLFDNPNDLAYSVVLIIPFAIGLFVSSDKFIQKICALTFLFIAIFCIYLTKSRGGYLATTVGITSWFYFWFHSKNIRKLVMVLGLVGVIVAFSMQTKNYRDDESSMGRVEAWVAGMNMLRDHPFIGVGKGQFIDHHTKDSHNSFVRAGAELGFIGLYAFVGILCSSFYSLFLQDCKKLCIDLNLYRVGFLAYLCSYIVASFFSSRPFDIIFMIVVALTSVLTRLRLDIISIENNSDAIEVDGVFNINVIVITVLVIIVWKLFLVQVW